MEPESEEVQVPTTLSPIAERQLQASRPPALDSARRTRVYRQLVRCASLAPSSHNTQPWRFRVEEDSISVLPDFSRRCQAVDPNDHHLFVSLGCAVENLLLTAEANGLWGHPSFDLSQGEGAIRIDLDSAPRSPSPLVAAIASRQCTRAEYNRRPVPNVELKMLEGAATGISGGVVLLTDPTELEWIAEYVAQGNEAQLRDRAFVSELERWMRFNAAEARRTGDGLFVEAFGEPTSPRWLGKLVMRARLDPVRQNQRDTKDVLSSSGIAVFFSSGDDIADWVDVGRRYERFALQATAFGIRNAFINQPVEVAPLRSQLASWLELGDRSLDLMVRFGYGPEMPRSYRRPVDEIIV
jgi:hypothetical protein